MRKVANRRRLAATAVVLLSTFVIALTVAAGEPHPSLRDVFQDEEGLGAATEGLNTRSTDGRAVVAAFTRRSYRPSETAVLKLWASYPDIKIELLHCGPEQQLTIGNETMEGVPVAGPFRVAGDHG